MMLLTVSIIGTLAVIIAALERILLGKEEESPLRRRWAYAFVTITLVINLFMHWLQYFNTTKIAGDAKKRLEGELAFALWAYTGKEEIHLKHLATSHQYILGYYFFKHDRHAEADAALAQAIRNDNFVAPSYYIRAVIKQNEKGDLEDVKTLVAAGIDHDPTFSPLYIARANVHADQHQFKSALADLEHAVNLNVAHCVAITNAVTNEAHSLHPLRKEQRFLRLQKNCDARVKGMLIMKKTSKD
jgi:tetratricopeptide (TPR) repeat protein